MPRFSIRQMLIATAVVAAGCFALINASSIVAAAMSGAVALLLVAAVVLSIYRTDDKRAFWIGFAIFGWSYLLLCYGPIFTENNSPFGWTRLVTGRLATALYDRIHGTTGVQVASFANSYPTNPYPGVPITVFVPSPPPPMPVPVAAGPAVPVAAGPDRVDFLNVAHSLWALTIALGGGWFAAWASRGRHKGNA
jgi:hypothetical protein